MSTVYVIVNEFLPSGNQLPLTEIVPPARPTYQQALEDLEDIARNFNVTTLEGDTMVSVPVKGTHLESDEYFIISLEVEDRG